MTLKKIFRSYVLLPFAFLMMVGLLIHLTPPYAKSADHGDAVEDLVIPCHGVRP